MAGDPGPTYYELFDLPPTASTEAIRVAYREAAEQAHPDGGGNAGIFRLITLADETLKDPLMCRVRRSPGGR